jgi:hypothetical protein
MQRRRQPEGHQHEGEKRTETRHGGKEGEQSAGVNAAGQIEPAAGASAPGGKS